MEDSRTFYYGRVSSKDQNLARQIEAFKALGAKDEQIITDKQSGKDFNRDGYNALKGAMGLRKGDTLVVKELDRLGRNKDAIKQELEYWKEKGVRIKVCDIPTTLRDFPEGSEWIQDMVTNILIEVMSTIAEQERLKINRRQAEGLEAMPVINGKKVSVKTGRPQGRPSAEFPKEWEAYYSEWKQGKITAKKCMDDMQLKRTTFYKLVKLHEEKTK